MLLTSVIILMVVLTKEILYKSTDPLKFIVNVVQFIESKI